MAPPTPSVQTRNWIRKEILAGCISAVVASALSLLILMFGIEGLADRIGTAVSDTFWGAIQPVRQDASTSGTLVETTKAPQWMSVIWRRVVSVDKPINAEPAHDSWKWQRAYTIPDPINPLQFHLVHTKLGDCHLLFDTEVLSYSGLGLQRKFAFTFCCTEAGWAAGPGWHGYVEPFGLNFARFIILNESNSVVYTWYARVDTWAKPDTTGSESRFKYSSDYAEFLYERADNLSSNGRVLH